MAFAVGFFSRSIKHYGVRVHAVWTMVKLRNCSCNEFFGCPGHVSDKFGFAANHPCSSQELWQWRMHLKRFYDSAKIPFHLSINFGDKSFG